MLLSLLLPQYGLFWAICPFQIIKYMHTFLGLTHVILTWPLFVCTSILTSVEPINWSAFPWLTFLVVLLSAGGKWCSFYYFFLGFYTHTTLRDGLMARRTELSRVEPLQVRSKYFRGGHVIIIFWPGEKTKKGEFQKVCFLVYPTCVYSCF